jgi:putative transposase
MKYNPGKHRRRSIRLKGYDYSQAGVYFVTICTKDRECLFGDIVDREMRSNDVGQMVHRTWNDLPIRNPGIETDEFVVMPNHVHGIIVIVGAPLVGAHSSGMVIDNAKTRAGTRPAPTLGDVVGAFKSITTHQYTDGVRQKNWPPFYGKLWQRNYYEHIIRSEQSLQEIREYIINNPLKWEFDRNNPANIIHRRAIHELPLHKPPIDIK